MRSIHFPPAILPHHARLIRLTLMLQLLALMAALLMS